MLTQDLRTKIFKAKQGDILVGRTAGDQSVLIVLVREVNALEGDALKERVTALETALAGGVSTDMLEYYGRALETRHGATFNQDAINSVFEHLSQVGY